MASRVFSLVAAAGLAMVLAGCSSTTWLSTWRDPEATAVDRSAGQTVVACVATDEEALRRKAEDALAAELGMRGLRAIPSYRLLPRGQRDEVAAKAAFEKAGAAAAVVLRPLGKEKEVRVTAPVYTGPYYRGFYGGYWSHAWAYPYTPGSVQTDTFVTVETLLYSLTQNRLVWAGRSETLNPASVEEFVKRLVVSGAREMERSGVFGPKQ